MTIERHPTKCDFCRHFDECIQLYFGETYDPKAQRIGIKNAGDYRLAVAWARGSDNPTDFTERIREMLGLGMAYRI